MAFEQRVKPSREFEKQLFDAIEELGFATARNGTEHTHPEFVKKLHQSTDQTSLAIRFQPDGIAQIGKIPRSFYVEAKAAKTIEKTAWEQYQKLYENGNVLVVVFDKLDRRWNFIEDIELVSAIDTVNRFPPERRFPVVDGWITPRGSLIWKKLRSSILRASGTPYREVNIISLHDWKSFKPMIIERLGETHAPTKIDVRLESPN